jgi:hypothetical protein
VTATHHIDRLKPSAAIAGTRRVLTLRWQISPHAIRRSPLAVIAAMNGQAEKIARAALVWHIAERFAAATLVLEVGEDDLTIPLHTATGRWTADAATGFEHADFGELLRVSLRDGQLAWARTSALDHTLALRGGVYEGPTVKV